MTSALQEHTSSWRQSEVIKNHMNKWISVPETDVTKQRGHDAVRASAGHLT